MKDIRMILPNMASDTAGAASLLFQLGGVSIIHDAAGSMESFITFDEQRDLSGKRTFASRLSRMEAITGDDRKLIDKIISECNDDKPPFIAIIGSPVPFTIGTDLDGIAAEAEFELDVPSFAVNAGAFDLYDRGASEALKKLIAKTANNPKSKEGYRINLLGATPLDYSKTEIAGIKADILTDNTTTVSDLTMTDGMEEIYSAAEADLNLVISISGLDTARYMKEKYSIPYAIGFEYNQHKTEIQYKTDGKPLLIIGEAVFAKNMVHILQKSGISAVAGVTGNDDKEIFPNVPTVYLNTEKSIKAELQKEYSLIVGDPLYRLLLPKDSGSIYVERPHRALSSRLYQPHNQTIDELIIKIKECL